MADERKTILMADDDPIYSMSESRLRKSFPDYDFEFYNSGKSLGERLEKGAEGVAMVVLDNLMPPGDTGPMVIEKYAQDGFSESSFLLVSGNCDQPLSKEDKRTVGQIAIEAGAAAYLVKPFLFEYGPLELAMDNLLNNPR